MEDKCGKCDKIIIVKGSKGDKGKRGPTGPTGPSRPCENKQYIFYNSGGNLLPGSNYQLLGIQKMIESEAQILIPEDGIITKLFIKLNNSPGSTRIFTIRKNSVGTPLIVAISGGNVQGTAPEIIPVVAGDLISLNHVSTGEPNPSGFAGSLLYIANC